MEVADVVVIQACLLRRGDWMGADALKNAVRMPLDYRRPALLSSRFHSDPMSEDEREQILTDANRSARESLEDDQQEIDTDLLEAVIRDSLERQIEDAASYDYEAARAMAEANGDIDADE